MGYYNYTRKDLLQRITELEFLNKSLAVQNNILKELSEINELTEVSKQRTLVSFLRDELMEVDSIKHPLCIVIFNIDDFKSIDDSKGYVYGDALKDCVAEIIQQHVRKTDLAGRFGGDEFMVILSNTDINFAQSVIDRIRKAVEATVYTDGVHITLSAAIKEYDSETIMDLIHFADMSFYKEKGYRKNRMR